MPEIPDHSQLKRIIQIEKEMFGAQITLMNKKDNTQTRQSDTRNNAEPQLKKESTETIANNMKERDMLTEVFKILSEIEHKLKNETSMTK